MNILAISSFGTVLETGLRTADGDYINLRKVGLKHNQILLNQIDFLVRDAGIAMNEIDLVLCTRGPGSFTAIRIVMSTAKGIAAGSEAAFIAVPTFDVVGHLFSWYPGYAVPVIDGRKGKYYTAVYENGKKLHPERDLRAAEFNKLLPPGKPVLIIGEDADSIAGELPRSTDTLTTVSSGFTLLPPLFETGTALFKNGTTCDTIISPLYIRKSDAELAKEKNT